MVVADAVTQVAATENARVYDGRSVMMATLSEGDLEPRGRRTGGTHQRGTIALSCTNI